MNAEMGKETMAFNNSDELQSIVLAAWDTTESPEDTSISSACRGREPPDLDHHACCIPRIYDCDQGKIFFP